MAKISISIEDEDLRWLRRRARRAHGGNLSAAVAEGMHLIQHREALGALLDRLDAPQLSADEVSALGAELDGPPTSGRKAKRRRAA